MKLILLIVTILLSSKLYASDPNCSMNVPLLASKEGVILCDVEGPNGEESFLACIPAPTNGSGRNVYGPISLKSYSGYEMMIVTSAVDNEATVTSSLKIINTSTREIEYSTRFVDNTANAWIKSLGDRPFHFICGP